MDENERLHGLRRAKLAEWFRGKSLPEREKSYFSQLINGKAAFGEKAARRIETQYGMPVNYLDTDDSVEVAQPKNDGIPVLSWDQAGQFAISHTMPDHVRERRPTGYRPGDRTYALRVVTDAMEPKFPDGAFLIVEPDEKPAIGQFVIVCENGVEPTFKQLVRDGSQLYLRPVNPRYPIEPLPERAVFCGVVKRVEMDV